jgi:hypothetical protein
MTNINYTERDAQEFGLHVKQGGWRLGLLVARNVEKGKDNGVHANDQEALTAVTASRSKVSAGRFAEQSGTSTPRVLRYLTAWESAADAGHVPHAATLSPGVDPAIDWDSLPPWTDFYKSNPGGLPKRLKDSSVAAVQEAIKEDPKARETLAAALAAHPDTQKEEQEKEARRLAAQAQAIKDAEARAQAAYDADVKAEKHEHERQLKAEQDKAQRELDAKIRSERAKAEKEQRAAIQAARAADKELAERLAQEKADRERDEFNARVARMKALGINDAAEAELARQHPLRAVWKEIRHISLAQKTIARQSKEDLQWDETNRKTVSDELCKLADRLRMTAEAVKDDLSLDEEWEKMNAS